MHIVQIFTRVRAPSSILTPTRNTNAMEMNRRARYANGEQIPTSHAEKKKDLMSRFVNYTRQPNNTKQRKLIRAHTWGRRPHDERAPRKDGLAANHFSRLARSKQSGARLVSQTSLSTKRGGHSQSRRNLAWGSRDKRRKKTH